MAVTHLRICNNSRLAKIEHGPFNHATQLCMWQAQCGSGIELFIFFDIIPYCCCQCSYPFVVVYVGGTTSTTSSPLLSVSPPPGSHTPAGMPGLHLGPGAADKPGFGVLLANSLKSEGVTKAWFDESCGYAYVKQSRVPLELPKVIKCNETLTVLFPWSYIYVFHFEDSFMYLHL